MKNVQSDIGIGDVDPYWKIGIVHSSFYIEDVLKMVEAAKTQLEKLGVDKDKISIHEVTGCFEIPLIGSALAEKGEVDALIGLGIVVQGQTHHAEEIVQQAARGMMDVQTCYRIPFAFEVLHVDDLSDAKARVEVRGREAAMTVMHSLSKIK